MKVSRDITNIINFILDNLCPPILRDCYPLMFPIYWIAYGKPTAKLMKYKDYYPDLTDKEYTEYYAYAAKARIAARPTDLNRIGLEFILSNTVQKGNCLDAGCGRGYLAKKLVSIGRKVYGLDIEIPPNYSTADGYTFVKGSLQNIPFPDEKFETVICAHVLEHVRDIDLSISELLRVTKDKLIIILPRQREYRYVADLHVRYFPYVYNVKMMFPNQNAIITHVGSDWGILIEKGERKRG